MTTLTDLYEPTDSPPFTSPPPTPPTPPERRSRWAWLKKPLPLWVALVALVLGLVIGVSGSSSKEPETASTATPVTTARPTTTVRTTTTARVTTTLPPTTTVPPTTTLPPTTVPEVPVQVLSVSGSSDKQTESFAVTGRWQIEWTIDDGAGVSIEVLTENGQQVDYVSTDPGSDVSLYRSSCASCYLSLSPFGSSYTITVTDLPG